MSQSQPVQWHVEVDEHIFGDDRPFAQCHASTLVELTDGGYLAAWFGGTAERNPDVGIWVSRFVEGRWSKPVEVANGIQEGGKRLPCWNPVLFQPKEGPLLLFFKVGPSPSAWWGEMMTSDDGGKTWRERKKLPGGGIGPVKDKPVQLEGGAILCPSSDEAGGKWRVHFERTGDLGKTWEKIGPVSR
jgi:predicted neuraminidase